MRYVIIGILVLYTSVCHAQFPQNKTLYDKKNQLIFNTKTLVIPGDDRYYLEEYSAGGGIFWGGAFKDTLQKIGDTLVGNKTKIYTKKGKYYIVHSDGKPRKHHFELFDTCDPEVNQLRNWHYGEVRFYQLQDTLQKSQGYGHSTAWDDSRNYIRNDKVQEKYCHAEYVAICDSVYTSLLQQISLDNARREERYKKYASNTVDAPFVRGFLRDITSSRFDQDIFYDLLNNHTALLLTELNGLSETKFHEVARQIIHMPKELNKEVIMTKVKDYPGTFTYRSETLRYMKQYWN
jgi:hypothetical protein